MIEKGWVAKTEGAGHRERERERRGGEGKRDCEGEIKKEGGRNREGKYLKSIFEISQINFSK